MKRCCVLQDHYDDERDKIVFHNTTPDLQDQDQDHSVQDQDRSVQDQDQDRFFWSQTGLVPCLKTDGLRPHHWQELDPIFQCYTLLAGILTGESNGMGLETIRMKDNGVRGLDRVIGQGRMGKY